MDPDALAAGLGLIFLLAVAIGVGFVAAVVQRYFGK